jgi:hypothetical protein
MSRISLTTHVADTSTNSKRIQRRTSGLLPRSSPALNIERKKSRILLNLRYKTDCPFVIIVYIVLQLVIGFDCIPVRNDYDIIPSLNVRFVNFGAGFAFTISVIQQLLKVYECRQPRGKKNLQGLHFSIAIMSGIAGTSSFLKFGFNLGVMQDVFGVYSQAAQWAG